MNRGRSRARRRRRKDFGNGALLDYLNNNENSDAIIRIKNYANQLLEVQLEYLRAYNIIETRIQMVLQKDRLNPNDFNNLYQNDPNLLPIQAVMYLITKGKVPRGQSGWKRSNPLNAFVGTEFETLINPIWPFYDQSVWAAQNNDNVVNNIEEALKKRIEVPNNYFTKEYTYIVLKDFEIDKKIYRRGKKLNKNNIISFKSPPLERIGRLSVLSRNVNKMGAGTLVYEVLEKPDKDNVKMVTICYINDGTSITTDINTDISLKRMNIEQKYVIPIYEEYALENFYGCLNYKDGKIIGRADWMLVALVDALIITIATPIALSSLASLSMVAGKSQAKSIATAVSILNKYNTTNVPLNVKSRALLTSKERQVFIDAAVFFYPICHELQFHWEKKISEYAGETWRFLKTNVKKGGKDAGAIIGAQKIVKAVIGDMPVNAYTAEQIKLLIAKYDSSADCTEYDLTRVGSPYQKVKDILKSTDRTDIKNAVAKKMDIPVEEVSDSNIWAYVLPLGGLALGNVSGLFKMFTFVYNVITQIIFLDAANIKKKIVEFIKNILVNIEKITKAGSILRTLIGAINYIKPNIMDNIWEYDINGWLNYGASTLLSILNHVTFVYCVIYFRKYVVCYYLLKWSGQIPEGCEFNPDKDGKQKNPLYDNKNCLKF